MPNDERVLPRAAASRASADTTALPAPDAGPGTDLHAPSAAAFVAPAVDPIAAVLALDAAASTSLGSPGRGTLAGGVALPDAGPGFVHNAKRPYAARFGSVELVQAIVRAAAVVDRELPGSVLVVNDIGLIGGGPIAQHGSHQSGRDADILFHMLDAKGEPLPSVGVPLDPKGAGWDFKDLALADDDVRVKLDPRRTWVFVRALLEAAFDDVQRIFIVEHVRTLLLEEAKARHAPARIIERFEAVTCQPGAPHDDHMHVRFWCAPDDIAAGCEDSPPLYPWRRQALAALGVKAVLAKAATSEERGAVDARTTSTVEARARAGAATQGRMHRKVLRFLAEREAWRKAPHPGRTYCR